MNNIQPEYWTHFVRSHELEWQIIDLPWPAELQDEHDDFDPIIEILDEKSAEDEVTALTLDCALLKNGFIPVGCCGYSSGGWYFINSADGPDGALYLISHEIIIDQSFSKQSSIVKLLDSYTEILKFVDK